MPNPHYKYSECMDFEAEVRRVAEAIWSLAPGECQPAHYKNNSVIRELDGVAKTRDTLNLIMATTSTKLDKIRSDIKKLNAAERAEKDTLLPISKWIITLKQLDAQHIDLAKKESIKVLTLKQFQRRFFDGNSYIDKRRRHAFGSARNPIDNSVNIDDGCYVELPIQSETECQVGNGFKKRVETNIVASNINDIIQNLINGEHCILMAPFGAGKSITTREIFKKIASDYNKSKTDKIPICINLREHWGQKHYDEILERHARSIGFAPKEDIVVAWRSGMVLLLLDGFDEVASQTIVRTNDIGFMKDARKNALRGVFDFISKLPYGIGVFFCGRDHYFDNRQEMVNALGLADKKFKIFRLGEFTENGAAEFLIKSGIKSPLPDWLPRKPLILSYLAKNNLFDDILAIDASEGFGYAWDEFLDKVCTREASLEDAAMDPQTVRAVMETIAYRVRATASGTGPITGQDLSESFRYVTDQPATDAVLAQLQRLPGLTQRDQDPGSRSFVDEDLLSALQGSCISNIILGVNKPQQHAPLASLPQKAINTASFLLIKNGSDHNTPIASAKRVSDSLQSKWRDSSAQQFVADCVQISMEMMKQASDDAENRFINFLGIKVESADIESIDLDELSISGITFNDCTIKNIILGENTPKSSLRVSACMINKISGISSNDMLPNDIFDDNCKIDEFDNVSTNCAVMKLDIQPSLKALVSVLRKLYNQPGAGRKLNAFKRGITQTDVMSKIDKVVSTLIKYEFITIKNNVVHPIRKKGAIAQAIINGPTLSTHPLVEEIKQF